MNAIRKYLPLTALIVLLYFPLFSHLDVLPIRMWDESRVACNAIEMHDNGNWIVTHYADEADHWNTKPPLTIWAQVICMKIFGVSELAVRLPSAISAFLCCLLLAYFSKKYLDNFWLGFVAALALVCSPGFVALHVSRTGDYDAMLSLFTTLSSLALFVYVEKKNSKWLYLFWVGLALAVLTKSIAGLLFLPGILVYIIWKKELKQLLINRDTYFGFALFTVLVLSYLLTRESMDPGYLASAFHNDVGGRFNKALDAHRGGFWFYFNHLTNGHFSYFYLILPLAWALGFATRNKKWQRLNAYLVCLTLSYFLVISFAETKIEWYDAPMIPVLALTIGLAISFGKEQLNRIDLSKVGLNFNPLPLFLLFLLFVGPYRNIIDKTFAPEELSWDKDFYEPEYWLRKKIKGDQQLDYTIRTRIYRRDYAAHWRFYMKMAQMQGLDYRFKGHDGLKKGDRLWVLQKNDLDELENDFRVRVMEDLGVVKHVEVRDTALKIELKNLVDGWEVSFPPIE